MDKWIKNLSEKAAKEILQKLVRRLDEGDSEDEFGTEGWRHSFDIEEAGRG